MQVTGKPLQDELTPEVALECLRKLKSIYHRQRILYYATIRPVLNNVNAAWLERCSRDNLHRLVRLQKRLLGLYWIQG